MSTDDLSIWETDALLSALIALDPQRFEEFIAELWIRRGWDTEVTVGSNDMGIDIKATKSFPYRRKALIQAKKYAHGNRVSGPEVQKYASLKQRNGVDEVIIVTTSGFTKQAIELKQKFNLKFIDGEQLIHLVRESDSGDLLIQFTDILTSCPSCDAAIDEEDKYCMQCGEELDPHRVPKIEAQRKQQTRIPQGDQSTQSTEDARALTIKARGRTLRVDDGETLGNQLRSFLTADGISDSTAERIHREHIGFQKSNGHFYVHQLGPNSVKVNGNPIDNKQWVEINPGDKISLSGVIGLEVTGYKF
ncbi:restriction endonuclease [Haloarcula laminariae]|uniref:restriction endonuclease n=1 Tax=Haloarcula laminariae TaxID=2961577 RepID=UPI0021C57AEE|nr:restriction endonuclease [Halomicroarcula laminariae]